jgi:hypothetical protein
MKRYLVITIGLIVLLFFITNPNQQSFKDYAYIELSKYDGMTKEKLDKYLIVSRTANYLIFSVYDFSYYNPDTKASHKGNFKGFLGSFH